MSLDATRLVGLLDELASVLDAHSEGHWAAWLRRDAARLRVNDDEGVTHFLSAFGGMGSLNDVVIRDPDARERFDRLKDDAWTAATALREHTAG